jgi:hypothetical protein
VTGLAALGERVSELDSGFGEKQVSSWGAGVAPVYALLFDARPAFAGGGGDPLRGRLEHAWIAVRSVAAGTLIPRGSGKRC